MSERGFDVTVTEVTQKKRTGLFNRKLRKAGKKFDKAVDEAINDAAELRMNTAKVKTLFEMDCDESVKKELSKIIDMLEYAAPSSSKEIGKLDSKIADRIDDVKLLIASNKSTEKILDKVDELRIAVVDRNNTVSAGV